ncbi:MAG: copper amine oxidase N-terminal domain-containing protein [Clostridia bacterium]|nr:copper amine oxidase N-terminal domain-containing protein [Clostridia bacterium]
MNKKIVSVICAGLMLFMSSAFAEEKTEETLKPTSPVISMTIGEKEMVFEGDIAVGLDVAPCIINDITMVPLRSIFECLGAKVQWDAETRTVYAFRNDVAVVLQIGQSAIFVDGARIDLDAPSVIVDDRTMIPLRSLASAYGYTTEYDELTKKVTITK